MTELKIAKLKDEWPDHFDRKKVMPGQTKMINWLNLATLWQLYKPVTRKHTKQIECSSVIGSA